MWQLLCIQSETARARRQIQIRLLSSHKSTVFINICIILYRDVHIINVMMYHCIKYPNTFNLWVIGNKTKLHVRSIVRIPGLRACHTHGKDKVLSKASYVPGHTWTPSHLTWKNQLTNYPPFCKINGYLFGNSPHMPIILYYFNCKCWMFSVTDIFIFLFQTFSVRRRGDTNL